MPDREKIVEKLIEVESVIERVMDEHVNDSREYYNELVRAVNAAIGIIRSIGTKPW